MSLNIQKQLTGIPSVPAKRKGIEKTERHELDDVLPIYNSARLFMLYNGNPHQWIDGYPQKEVILSHIENNQHYLCLEKSKIMGCFALIEGDDPTYRRIKNGKWLNHLPYAVTSTIGIRKKRQRSWPILCKLVWQAAEPTGKDAYGSQC